MSRVPRPSYPSGSGLLHAIHTAGGAPLYASVLRADAQRPALFLSRSARRLRAVAERVTGRASRRRRLVRPLVEMTGGRARRAVIARCLLVCSVTAPACRVPLAGMQPGTLRLRVTRRACGRLRRACGPVRAVTRRAVLLAVSATRVTTRARRRRLAGAGVGVVTGPAGLMTRRGGSCLGGMTGRTRGRSTRCVRRAHMTGDAIAMTGIARSTRGLVGVAARAGGHRFIRLVRCGAVAGGTRAVPRTGGRPRLALMTRAAQARRQHGLRCMRCVAIRARRARMCGLLRVTALARERLGVRW